MITFFVTATIVTVFQPSVVALVGLENMSRLLSALMPAIGAGQFIASPFTGSKTIVYGIFKYNKNIME